jgi:hypothetical protein
MNHEFKNVLKINGQYNQNLNMANQISPRIKVFGAKEIQGRSNEIDGCLIIPDNVYKYN